MVPASLVCFVTGCAQGIGRQLATDLLARGHRVVATDLAAEVLTRAATEQHWDPTRSLTLAQDVTDAAQWPLLIAQAVARFGRLDVLVNNAGVITPGFIHQTTVAAIDQQLGVNLRGLMYGSKFAADVMVAQGSGQIINIASLAGVAPIRGMNVYSASKFGARGFSLAIADELREHGVTVSVVCPDLTRTAMLDQLLDHDSAAMTFSGGRVLTVADVSAAIIDQALTRRKLEVLLPAGRGLLSKLGNFFPALSAPITAMLTRRGLKNLRALRQQTPVA